MVKQYQSEIQRGGIPSAIRTGILVSVIGITVLLIAAQPALAQENPICQEESGTLINMIEGFVQITTGIGIMGVLLVWQADSLMEMFTLSQEQQYTFKQHRRSALKSAGILVVLGPMFTLLGTTMELPIANCVDIVPF